MSDKNPWWLIWSIGHQAWWAQGGMGYTKIRSEAWRLTFEQAMDICVMTNSRITGDTPGDTICPDWGAR